MGLNKQVWTTQLMSNFYPESSFLRYVKDFTTLVDNDIINMAEAGVDPNVLINNTTYPIKVVQRVDKPISIELDLFETENTLVRRPEVIEYSYDQLESVRTQKPVKGRNRSQGRTRIRATEGQRIYPGDPHHRRDDRHTQTHHHSGYPAVEGAFR